MVEVFPLHEITFEGFVTAPKYSCDSTINRKMTSYEALTSSDVLISHSDSRLDNFIRLLLNGPLESHWIRGLKLTSKFRAVQFWVNWKKMTTKSERRTSVSSSTVCFRRWPHLVLKKLIWVSNDGQIGIYKSIRYLTFFATFDIKDLSCWWQLDYFQSSEEWHSKWKVLCRKYFV